MRNSIVIIYFPVNSRMETKIYILFITILLFMDNLNVLSNSNDVIHHRFLVNTEGCEIPAFPLLSADMQKLVNIVKPSNCSENIRLLDYNSTHIWVLEDSLDYYNVMTLNDFYCCYRYFYAEDNIAEITYGPCVEFSLTIKAEHEFTRVECYYLDIKTYDDFFLFPKFIKTKVSNLTAPTFNILLFGIESMSRINFLRTMPMTSKFFEDKGSIQLLGYNKVGDNSFPNLFPLFVGKSYEQVKELCIHENVIDTSECTFLWTKFKEAGYHTVLASDSIAGLFGNYEYSLPEIPTDFYLQPFIFETKNIYHNKHYNYHQCLRNEYFYKIFLNWSVHLLKKSKNKLFGIFWEESISHENLKLTQGMDDDYYIFFKELENSKHLDNTIVILFSDHGMRWGETAQTLQGRAENRLPLFEILFPKKFQTQYSLAFKNVKQNARRLSSAYDVHETLLDLIYNHLEDHDINKRSKYITRVQKKISLFLPIPEQRECTFIGITDHWCTCQKEETTVVNETHKIFIAKYMINQINKRIEKYKQCHQLTIQNIFDISTARDNKNKTQIYKIMLQTSPGSGIFEGTLLGQGEPVSVSGFISRLNLYRNTSQCIQDDDLKMYCTCK